MYRFRRSLYACDICKKRVEILSLYKGKNICDECWNRLSKEEGVK